MDSTVDISTAVRRVPERGGAGAWEATDELCPRWWPRRRGSPRRALRANEGHADVRAADRVYLALTLLATTYELTDERLAREVRGLAVNHLLDAAQVLTRGAIRAWVHGDDICPPWPIAAGAADRDPPLPGRAGHLLDVLVLLHAYSLAARLTDAGARSHATIAIAQALRDQVAIVARSFA